MFLSPPSLFAYSPFSRERRSKTAAPHASCQRLSSSPEGLQQPAGSSTVSSPGLSRLLHSTNITPSPNGKPNLWTVVKAEVAQKHHTHRRKRRVKFHHWGLRSPQRHLILTQTPRPGLVALQSRFPNMPALVYHRIPHSQHVVTYGVDPHLRSLHADVGGQV
ncbi:hypothetical protein BKA70DRAFT_1355705 [Coprinopsis sp. MPI-PUGE-AT-0042]|nr:hypothetical protein BKA70DRAFT_1355705 [Coprinopsis sp. MPI-PUGE-AT-0042]